MEIVLENVNILDEIFFEKVKSAIINADLDKNKEYDIEIRFDELLCISEEMYKYFVYKVPPEKLRKHINYQKISSVNDCSIYAGEVLSYILDNILLLLLETDIKIRNAKIIGAMYYRKNNTKIELVDSKKDSEYKLKSIMPSETSFCKNLKEGMDKIIKARELEKNIYEQNKKDVIKKEVPDVDAAVSLDLIAKQLGVSEEKLQEFINRERCNR